MDFRFSNLLCAPYRGGDLLLHENTLVTPVGNRVGTVNLTHATSSCLPCQSSTTVRTLALSPTGGHLLVFDEDGRALLVNFKRRVVLHHLKFKAPVVAARFSPCGSFFAVACGKLLQVWRTPAMVKEFAPFQLHRTYGGCHDDTTCLDWSQNSRWLAVGSKDLTARVYSRETVEDYLPPTLAGHRDTLVRVFFVEGTAADADHNPTPTATATAPPGGLLTVSRDGALFDWVFDPEAKGPTKGEGKGGELGQKRHSGQWRLKAKHFFNQPAKLTCADYHKETSMFVAGFSTGIFMLYQMPGFDLIHTLSVSRERVSAISFNESGDWLALGCSTLGQLLVWEWRSETYVLKQQGHYFDVTTHSYSPDGTFIATGADDNKVKVWNVQAGSCFVTFKEHAAPVTAVHFLPSGTAVLSASLDGTVRAFDLVRYRNFRTFAAPDPCQFVSLAVDHAGEIVCAGTVDTFEICVWSLRTGKLLDVLNGHQGPVYGLSFCPTSALLASSSWDKTVRTWDVFEAKGAVEPLEHTHDVLTVAYRPDGKQLCSATLDGQLYFWAPFDGVCQGTIEGRRDLAPGRKRSDRITTANNSSGRCFSSICYSADGALLLAGGHSKYVCLYDVEDRVLLRRFQIATSYALDGVLDQLSTRSMTDAGPMELLDTAPSDSEEEDAVGGGSRSAVAKVKDTLPGNAAAARPTARVRCVRLSPTLRGFTVATTEGLLVYGLDEETMFDPTDLGEDVTPAAAESALAGGAHVRALLLALRLKDLALVRRVLEAVPAHSVQAVAQEIPPVYLARVLAVLTESVEGSPHVEHILRWLRLLGVVHIKPLQQRARELMPTFRRLNKALQQMHEDLADCAGANMYTLRYLSAAPQGEGMAAGDAEVVGPSVGGRPTIEADEGSEGDDDGDWGGAWVGSADMDPAPGFDSDGEGGESEGEEEAMASLKTPTVTKSKGKSSKSTGKKRSAAAASPAPTKRVPQTEPKALTKKQKKVKAADK